MSIDVRLDRIESKIDKSAERISSIDVTLGQQHVSLKEHMRRTALIEAELTPIKAHVSMITGFLKVMGGIGALTAMLAAGISILKYLGGHS